MTEPSKTFEYTFNHGGTVTFPHMDDVMTAGFARRTRKLDNEERMWELLEAGAAHEDASEDFFVHFDAIKADEIEEFFDAWQKESGATAGESTGSATKSRSTKRR